MTILKSGHSRTRINIVTIVGNFVRRRRGKIVVDTELVLLAAVGVRGGLPPDDDMGACRPDEEGAEPPWRRCGVAVIVNYVVLLEVVGLGILCHPVRAHSTAHRAGLATHSAILCETRDPPPQPATRNINSSQELKAKAHEMCP